jgi:hypothetical protein
MADPAEKTSVSLFQEDRAIVGSLAKRKGLNFSSALRQIIREWKEMKEQRVWITEAGKAALKDAQEHEPEP